MRTGTPVKIGDYYKSVQTGQVYSFNFLSAGSREYWTRHWEAAWKAGANKQLYVWVEEYTPPMFEDKI